MGVAFENFAVIDPDALENAVPIQQAMVVDAQLGVGLVEKLAIDPDFRGHRHSSSFLARMASGVARRGGV